VGDQVGMRRRVSRQSWWLMVNRVRSWDGRVGEMLRGEEEVTLVGRTSRRIFCRSSVGRVRREGILESVSKLPGA